MVIALIIYTMKYTLKDFQEKSESEIKDSLKACCGSSTWVDRVTGFSPAANERELFDHAISVWEDVCVEKDVLEAFSHHPEIGDLTSLSEKYESTANWASDEQAGTSAASIEIIETLATLNKEYKEKFGFVFLVCATGKSAQEMTRLITERLKHSKHEELHIAKEEQLKITLLRLQKLLDLKEGFWNQASHVTTHVLDTSVGIPGEGICIRLKHKAATGFSTLAIGITNQDGRIANLLAPGIRLQAGHYQMCFDTAAYFESLQIKGFYPKVDIDFEVFDDTHYHVPLLINPFGYSTYRGS